MALWVCMFIQVIPNRGSPPAIKVTILSDRTTTIRASVKDVQFTLLLTIGLDGMSVVLRGWSALTLARMS